METFYFISPKSTSQPIRSTKTVILTGVFTAKLPLIVLPLIHRALVILYNCYYKSNISAKNKQCNGKSVPAPFSKLEKET